MYDNVGEIRTYFGKYTRLERRMIYTDGDKKGRLRQEFPRRHIFLAAAAAASLACIHLGGVQYQGEEGEGVKEKGVDIACIKDN